MANPMNGIQLTTNIAMVTMQFDQLITHINATIKQPFNLNININQIQQQLSQVTKQTEQFKSAMNSSMNVSNNSFVNQMDKNVLASNQEMIKITGNMQKIEEQYKKLGNYKITPISSDASGNIQKFTVQLEQVEGLINKIKYDTQSAIAGANGSLVPQTYKATGVTTTDNTQAIQIKQQNVALNEAKGLLEQESALTNQIVQANEKGLVGKARQLALEREIVNAKLNTSMNSSGNSSDANQIALQEIKNGLIRTEGTLQAGVADKQNLSTAKINEQIALYQGRLNPQIDALILKMKSVGIVDTSGLEKYKMELNSLTASGFNKGQMTQGFTDLKTSANSNIGTMQNLTKETKGFLSTLASSATKMAQFALAGGLMMGVISVFKQGISSVMEFDNSINALRIDMMGANESAFDALAQGSQNLSLKLGTNIKDITDIMEVYSNANSTAQEILAKTQPSAILSNISGMTGKDASDAIQSVLLVFDEFKNSSDSIATQGMKVSDVFASVASKLSLDFKTGLTSMSAAVKTSGAVINEAGMNLTTYSAIVGKLAETSRLSGETIGASMKTIVSRITRANTGDSSAEEVSNADKSYQSIGINVRDANGGFKDLDTTLTSLSKVWESLSGQQRSYIAEQSAGVRQKAVFLNMMDNYADSTKLATEALSAQGIASAKNDIYLQSSAARIKQFQNAVAILFQNMINSNGLKNFIGIITGIVSALSGFTKTFGLLGTTVAVVAEIIAVKYVVSVGKAVIASRVLDASNRLSAIATIQAMMATGGLSEANGVLAISNLTASASGVGFVASLKTIIAGLFTTGVASEVASVGLAGVQIAMIGVTAGLILIPMAIGAVINAFSSANKANEDYIKTTQDSITKLKTQQTDMGTLTTTYDSLASNTNRTTDEQKQFLDVQNQIIGIAPTLLDHYDAEGNAYVKNTSALKDYTEQLKIQQAEKQKDLQGTYGKEIDKASAKQDALRKKLDTYNKTGSFSSGKIGSEQIISDADIKEVNTSLKAQSDIIVKNKENIKSGVSEYAVLTKESKLIADSMIGTLPYKDAEQYATAIQSVTNKLKSGNIEKQTSDYAKLSEEYKSGKVSVDKMTKGYDSLHKTLVSLHMQSGDIDKILPKPDTSDINNMALLIQQVNGYADAQSKMQESVSKSESAVKDLNGVIYKQHEGNTLNAEEISDLIVKYPELAGAVKGSAGAYTIEEGALQSLRTVHISEAKTIMETQLNATKAVLEGVKSRLSYYGVEMGAIQSLATAKLEASKVSGDTSEEGANTIKDAVGIPYIKSASDAVVTKQKAEQKSLQDSILQYGTSMDAIKALEKTLKDPTFGTTKAEDDATAATKAGTEADKENASAKADQTEASKALTKANKELADATKASTNSVKDYDSAMKALSITMSLLDVSQEKLEEHSQAYRDGMKQKAKLIQN
ncbi:MAG TPA: phage tail tape measure protein, partial [Clostridium sp.]|uniref:phage tail tape measure protein n=1 Tax=Clostridium sp. TaxID=1506 RepID=UPI002F930512